MTCTTTKPKSIKIHSASRSPSTPRGRKPALRASSATLSASAMMGRVDVQEFEREVKMQLEVVSIVIDRYQALNDRAVLEALPMTQYAQVLTVCYENYCEFYGPAKADQLYANVKRQVKERYPMVDMHRLI